MADRSPDSARTSQSIGFLSSVEPLLSEFVGVAVWLDGQGRIVEANSRVSGLTGRSASELEGVHFFSLLSKEYRVAAATAFGSVKSGRTVETTLVFLGGKSGRVKWCPLVGAEGSVAGALALIRAATEVPPEIDGSSSGRNGINEALTRLPVGVWTTDSRGLIVLWEGHGRQALGLAPGDPAGICLLELARDWPGAKEALHDGLAGHESKWTTTTEGGTWEHRVHPRLGANGDTAGLYGVSIEVTEQAARESELREAKDYLHSLIDGLPEPVMVINTDYSLAFANQAVRGIQPGPGLAERKCYDLSHGIDTPCTGEGITCPLKAVMETKQPVRVTHTHVNANGEERIFELSAAPILDEAGEVIRIVEIGRDATARIRATEERKKLESRIHHAQKLESLGILAGGIAHDFNNLLMGILGNADLALIEGQAVPSVRESLREIKEAAFRAGELAREMLAYSGKGRFVVEPVNLAELVPEMASLLAVSFSKKITLSLDLPQELPWISADSAQLRQVVMNLIVNASEAIGDEMGEVIISATSRFVAGEEGVEIPVQGELPAGRYVVLEVTDSGCGMDRATLERLFDPFFTTKRTGRGLGMAAVQGIVRGHGGAIEISSQLGQGTTFRVMFPAIDIEDVQREMVTKESLWTGSGLALVVDTDQSSRSVTGRMLQKLGFQVVTAKDGRGAIETLNGCEQEILFVLMNPSLPDMSGQEAVTEIRKLGFQMPIILCGGYDEEDVLMPYAEGDVSGYIQKPYPLTVLREKVRGVLQ